MRRRTVFPMSTKDIDKPLAHIQSFLEECKMDRESISRGILAAEETIGSLAAHASGEGSLRVVTRRFLGEITVEMAAPGEEYTLTESMPAARFPLDEDIGPETQEAIRNVVIRSMVKGLRYRHARGENYIRLTLAKSTRGRLYLNLGAFVLGILLTLLLNAVAPASVMSGLNEYIMDPIKTIYLNLLKTIVAPVVFFSIISCISGFTNFSELGRIGGKTMILYMVTTLFAVTVGIGVFYLLQPGDPSMAAAMSGGAPAAVSMDQISLRSTLIGLFPSNLLAPFQNNDMPQLIFLAVLCGVPIGLIGKYSATLRTLVMAFNELFTQIAGLLIRLMPIAVFCSASSMMISMGTKSISALAAMFGTFLFGLLVMMLIYSLMLLILGRVSPVRFYRLYGPYMLQIFSMAASNAGIPLNLNFCREKMGISSKVCNLSIPLGATINMDGMCVQLAVFVLTLARIYGVEVPTESLLMMAGTIIILSIGAPGVPGAGIICMTLLLEQLHVPTDGLGMVMGIAPLIGMFLSMSNCLGDVVATVIVAKRNGYIDRKVYEKNFH